MNQYTPGSENPFLDLSAFDHVSAPVKSASSSIIKSSTIAETGIAKIEIFEGCDSEPTITVQRDGDRIIKIDFICACGKTAHLDVKYEEE